jgi:hypothetical protein
MRVREYENMLGYFSTKHFIWQNVRGARSFQSAVKPERVTVVPIAGSCSFGTRKRHCIYRSRDCRGPRRLGVVYTDGHIFYPTRGSVLAYFHTASRIHGAVCRDPLILL